MTQVHKRFTVEQVKVLFQGYLQGNLSRAAIEELLEIGKTRFFALLKAYRQDPQAFSIAYQRATKGRLTEETELVIQQELLREKALIDDKELPIHDYNYSALADRLKNAGAHIEGRLFAYGSVDVELMRRWSSPTPSRCPPRHHHPLRHDDRLDWI